MNREAGQAENLPRFFIFYAQKFKSLGSCFHSCESSNHPCEKGVIPDSDRESGFHLLSHISNNHSRGVAAPHAVFIFFDKLQRKRNQKKSLPCRGAFLLRFGLLLLNSAEREFALRQTRCVCVAVAV
jgi:hypothetical protein